MRHARAESVAASDEERVLTPGGRADAVALGRWLVGEGYAVDHGLISSSARTRQTWDAVIEGAGLSVSVEVDGSVYAGGPDTVQDLICQTVDRFSCLLVIGHNPTIAHLAQLLDDGEGDPDATASMAGGFPPCAVAVYQVPDSWRSLEVGSARLVAFHVGAAV